MVLNGFDSLILHGETVLSRPVLPFCPFWLHTLICLNSPELHCWLSSHPHCIKMLGFCFRVYVRRSQGAGTDPAKDSMPRACRRGQGLPSDLPKDSLRPGSRRLPKQKRQAKNMNTRPLN